MTVDNITPKNPLIQGMPEDTFDRVSESLTRLLDHLSKQADSDTSYPEIADVFYGLSHTVRTIKEAINYEAGRAGNTRTDTPFEHWLTTMPSQFPDVINGSKPLPPFKNPLIGEQQEDTYRAIHDGITLLVEMALPWPGNESFGLSKSATRGYVHYLESLQGALFFEMTHRVDGGTPTEFDHEGD